MSKQGTRRRAQNTGHGAVPVRTVILPRPALGAAPARRPGQSGTLTSLLVDGWLLVDVGIWAGGLCREQKRVKKTVCGGGGGKASDENGDSGTGAGRKFTGSCQEPRQNQGSWDCPLGDWDFLYFSGWVGGRTRQGPQSLGALPGVWHWGSGQSREDYNPRWWGTESKGLGFLKEKSDPRKRVQPGRQ